MTDEQMHSLADILTSRERKQKVGPGTIASVAATIFLSLGGWCINLNSRLAVLESQSVELRDTKADISALKQQVTDFRNEFDDWRREQSQQRQNQNQNVQHYSSSER